MKLKIAGRNFKVSQEIRISRYLEEHTLIAEPVDAAPDDKLARTFRGHGSKAVEALDDLIRVIKLYFDKRGALL